IKASQDFVFKRVFGAESHKRVLVCLLNAILKGNPHIKSVELDNTEIPKDKSDGKNVRLDIRARTSDNTVINVEIQCADRGELIHRSAFYQARMMLEEVKSGESYNIIPDMISIWIADYKATDRKHHTNEILYMYKSTDKDPIEIATDKFRTFIIELSKIEFKNIHRADMFSVWMMFIKHPEEIPDEFLSIPEVKEAMDELTYLSHDKVFRAEYDARQRLINDENAAITIATEKGLEKGREEGLEKGLLAKARETAVKLIAKNMATADIAEVTDLSEKEILELQKSDRKQ
ncbi:MAG: Rpn family recombination-promoting nuclease/putative transposase, partial [Holosporales bacterium]|nr:Rpn family recombination-promoting nuclease/putative transposase [Holosporales bacterium]